MYTVDASNNHLQETYLPAIGDPWVTQDLSAKDGTPAALSGPTAVVVHDGYTSVYTEDYNGHLDETYLPAIGDPWTTQDLTAKYGAPIGANGTVALYHNGYTSLYTVAASNNHLDETYLPAIGDSWTTQDLTAKYGTPVASGNNPVPLVHPDASGVMDWVSVFTADAGTGPWSDTDDLQETYLPHIGSPWYTQDLSAKYGTPKTEGF